MIDKLPEQYLAELRAEGHRFALTVNGIDIAQFADQGADVFSARLNVWLRHGPNRVSASFGAPVGTSGSTRLVITAMDAARNATELYDSSNSAGGGVEYVIHVPLRTGTVLDRLAAGPPGTDSYQGVLVVVQELHRLFEEKQFDKIIALQRIQLEEKSAALGLPVERSIHGYREFLGDLWSSSDWSLEPLEPVVRPTAIAGLVQVTDRNGAPAIRARNSEVNFAVNPFFAYIDNHWKIVR